VSEADTHRVTLEVNGVARELEVESRMLLLDVLRGELGLVGAHAGCEHGVCGSCTVLVDGRSTRSCITFAVQVDGRKVETVEGLAEGEQLHPVQEAFWRCNGLQCGFCTPGMVLRAVEFLGENPDPTREEAREAMASNLCRCTGYQHIVDSVMEGAARLRGEPWSDEASVPAGDTATATEAGA
jgi:aerobic carbon-monoxide dehydrogenase small subunit